MQREFGDGLSSRVRAYIRFAIKGEIIRMAMRGKFSPSEDLKSELMGKKKTNEFED